MNMNQMVWITMYSTNCFMDMFWHMFWHHKLLWCFHMNKSWWQQSLSYTVFHLSYMHVVCTRVPDCNTYVCQKEVPKTVFCQWAHGYLFTLFPFSAPHSLPPTRRRMSRFLASRIDVPFVPFSHMGQPRPIRRLLQMPPMGMPACSICSIWVSNHRPPLGMLISFWQPSL